MARTQAKIIAAIWTDPEWVALTANAQRTYFLLLSQPKLTLAGCLDWVPQRWGRLSADQDHQALLDGLAELIEATYIVAHDDELVIRTFVEHDFGSAEKVNRNLVKGMWSAWAAISSPVLQKVVVDNLPKHLLSDAPERALERASEPPLRLPLERASEPSVDLSLNPEPCSLNPEPVADFISGQPQVVAPPASATDDEVEQSVRKAVGLLARTRAAQTPGVTDPGAYAATVARNLDPTERQELHDLVRDGHSPAEAAAVVADPLRGVSLTGTPHDPQAVAVAAQKAHDLEAATADRLAAMRATQPATAVDFTAVRTNLRSATA